MLDARRLAVCCLVVACLTGCTGSPAIVESAPSQPGQGQTAMPSASAAPLTTPDPAVIVPGSAPDDTQPFQGQGFLLAVPSSGFTHDHDKDIDEYRNDSTGEELVVVTRVEPTLADAVHGFNEEDPATAIDFHGVAWQGATAAAYGERTFTEGDLKGITVAALFAQLPSGKVISVSAGAPKDHFEDSLALACLNTLVIQP